MNGMFYFLVATLRCEGLAILPRTECIDYVNADGKKDTDMTLHKGCIREESIQGGSMKFKKQVFGLEMMKCSKCLWNDKVWKGLQDDAQHSVAFYGVGCPEPLGLKDK